MTVERAAGLAKAALDAKLDERCVRCGVVRRDSGPWCRDDHDHSFKPADHWLHRRAKRVVDDVMEHIFPAPADPDGLEVPRRRCSCCGERFDGAVCDNCGEVAA